MITKRERQVLSILRENPMKSQKEIADTLEITRSSVSVHISNLIDKGLIQGRGYILNEDSYVLAIGGANVDIIGSSNSDPIFRDSNPGHVNIYSGGVARNIAENLSMLGLNVKLITAIGKDEHGEILLRDGKNSGVDMSNSIIVNEKTAVYLAILDGENDLQLAVSDMDIIDKISPKILENKFNIIKNANLCVLDTNLKRETLEYLLKNNGNKFFLDPVSVSKTKKILNLLPYIHTIKPNKYEAELLSNMKITNEEDIIRAGKKIVAKGVRRVFLTMGEEGVYYFDKDKIVRAKSKKIKARNATGAGDAFMSGLVYSYINKFNIEETLNTAIGASRLSLKSEDTINKNLNIEDIEKEKEAIEIC